MDERTLSVVQSVQRFMDEVVQEVREQTDRPDAPSLSAIVAEHLGQVPSTVPIVRLDVDAHQFVNLDVAMAALVAEHGGGTVVGVGGGDMRHHQTFGDFLQRTGPWNRFRVGAVDRERVETGPSSHRDAVAFGIHLFRYRGQPVAVQQRRANPQFGGRSGLEVAAPEELAGPLLADVRRLMVERQRLPRPAAVVRAERAGVRADAGVASRSWSGRPDGCGRRRAPGRRARTDRTARGRHRAATGNGSAPRAATSSAGCCSTARPARARPTPSGTWSRGCRRSPRSCWRATPSATSGLRRSSRTRSSLRSSSSRTSTSSPSTARCTSAPSRCSSRCSTPSTG